jgi:hypothetical protein
MQAEPAPALEPEPEAAPPATPAGPGPVTAEAPAPPEPPPTAAPGEEEKAADLPSPYSLLQALAAPPEAAPSAPPPETVGPEPSDPEAAEPEAPEHRAAEETAELPLPVLFHAIAATPDERPKPTEPAGFALLDLALPRAESAAPAAPPREAPRLTLLDALPPPKSPEASPALPSASPQAAALRPSPLLEALRTTPPDPVATPAPRPPAPPEATAVPDAEPAPRTLPEREVRAVFELLVGRPPQPAELDGLQGFSRRMALREAIMASAAFRDAVLAPAAGTAPPQADSVAEEEDLAGLDALGAAAPGEPGMVVDWFGLRTPLAIAPELAEHAGKALPKPFPSDPRATAAEWIGVAASVAGAKGGWRALFVGSGRGDLLLSGAVAARRRGLGLDLHATEPVAGDHAALLRHAEANGIDPGAGRFQQVAAGADPGRPPPRGALVQDLLAGGEPWDWVGIAPAGLLGILAKLSTPLLGERVRFLSLVTRSRGEEAVAIRSLSQAGWRLVAEQPMRMTPRDLRKVDRPGAQVWRGPLA